MRKPERKHIWCSAIAAVLAVLVFSVTVLVPLYLNSTGVKEKIRATVEEKLGGKVSYGRIGISLFPRPRATVEGLALAYPRVFTGTLRSLSIAPQILPLFTGTVAFSKIAIDGPDFRIVLPAPKADTASGAPTLEEMKASIRSVMTALEAIGPGLVVEMDHGTFLLRRGRRDLLSLRDVSVHFNAPPGDIRFLVRAGTEQWGDFGLRGAYSFTESETEIKDLALSLGRSSLTDCSALLTWEKDPRIEIRSGRAEFSLGEIYDWLRSVDSLTPFMKELSSLQGRLAITSMKGQGPLSRPGEWRMRMTGELRAIELASPRLPAHVHLDSGFAVEDNLVEVTDLSGRMGRSSLSHVSALLTGRKATVLDLTSGQAQIDLTQIFGWRAWLPSVEHLLSGMDEIAGRFTLSSLRIKGKLDRPLEWKVYAAGALDNVAVSTPLLPGPVRLVKGIFSYLPDTLSVSLREAAILDSTVSGEASITGLMTTVSGVDATVNGSSGRKTVDWAFENLKLPPGLMVRTPLSLSDARVNWRRGKGVSFSGTATVAKGPSFFADLSQEGGDLDIRKLVIRDQEGKATMSLAWKKQSADLSYSGRLAQSTLSRIFEQGSFGNGTMEGELHTVVRIDQPLKSRMSGSLQGSEILIPWGMPIPTTVNKFALHADDDVLTLDSADVTWGANHYALNGAITTSDEGLAFSMKLGADGIDIEAIQQALAASGGKKPEAGGNGQAGQTGGRKPEEKKEEQVRSFPIPPIRGDFTADSAYIKFGHFLLAPAHAVMTVDPDAVGMEFSNTKTCGIDLAGTVRMTKDTTSFTFAPRAKATPLGQTIDCLTGAEMHITGEYDLTADLRSQGKGMDLLPGLEGRVDFKARDGKIYRYPTLQKILSVLSVLEIFRGRIPQIGGSGFPYSSMALRGDIHKGVFTIEKAYIGGQSLDILAEGEVDFAKQKIDVVVLVAPFSTINWYIRHIPLVNTIMSGTLISIPTRVSGDLANPDVAILSPTAVGGRILKMFTNILKAPVELVSPLFTDTENKEEEKK